MRYIVIVLCVIVNFILNSTFLLNAQIITTVAGGATGHGGYWGEGGQATAAELLADALVSIDDSGNLFIGDRTRILKVNVLTGIINTIAGTGNLGYNGDGILATDAQLNYGDGVVFDHFGNIYIGDAENNRVRKINKTTAIINTFAGNGILGSSGDLGPATNAELFLGYINWDIFGNFYLGDKRKIRKIDSFGIITTIIGTGLVGTTVEGGSASSTAIGEPYGIATDRGGNIYFADSSEAIWKVSINTGIINRIAGTGDRIASPYSGDGISATACHIGPQGIYVDDTGNLYIADEPNNRIEKVDTFGIIHTIAGTGIAGYSGDGRDATSAQIYGPQNIAFDACGNMYIADFGNLRIRKVTYPPTLTVPSISLSGTVSAYPGTSVTITATVANAGSSYLIEWMNHGIEFTTTTVPSVTYTKTPGIDTITANIVPTSYGCWDSTLSAGHVVDDGSTVLLSLSSKTGFAMYPNPAGNSLYLVSGKVITGIEIDNLFGLPIFTKTYKDSNVQIDISGLPTGIYAIKVNGIWVQKLIKE